MLQDTIPLTCGGLWGTLHKMWGSIKVCVHLWLGGFMNLPSLLTHTYPAHVITIAQSQTQGIAHTNTCLSSKESHNFFYKDCEKTEIICTHEQFPSLAQLAHGRICCARREWMKLCSISSAHHKSTVLHTSSHVSHRVWFIQCKTTPRCVAIKLLYCTFPSDCQCGTSSSCPNAVFIIC